MSDSEIIMEVKRLTFELKFAEAFNLTRQIQNNEFAVRTAMIVMSAEHSHECGCFKGAIQ
jgi:hypothetical protein